MNTLQKLLVTGAVLASATLAFADASTAPGRTDKRLPNGLGLGIFNHNVDTSKIEDPALKALVEQFQAQREAMIAERKALMESLKTMTKEEKAAAIKAWEESHRTDLQANRELAKQIRDQLRQLREDRRSRAGNGG